MSRKSNVTFILGSTPSHFNKKVI